MATPLSIPLVEPRDTLAALGGWIRALRQRANWTQPDLASRSGVPVATLSRLERTGRITTDRLMRILFALDALDPFHDFLADRCRLADLPADLRDYHPAAPRPARIRHPRHPEGAAP